MPEVKIRRRNVSAEEAAAVISSRFGDQVEIISAGDTELSLRQGLFARAKVSISDEPGGTVFKVRGAGPPFPLIYAMMLLVNQGIVKRVATVLGENEEWQSG